MIERLYCDITESPFGDSKNCASTEIRGPK